MTTKQENLLHLVRRLERLGFTLDEISALLRIERVLHRWAELECNGDIQRDELTNKPYAEYGSYVEANDPRRKHYVADREAGALKRLAKIMEPHKRRLVAYHQGDPRGCALYIVPKKDIPKGERLDAYYSRGTAVCF